MRRLVIACLMTFFIVNNRPLFSQAQLSQNKNTVRIKLDKLGVDVISKQGMSLIPLFEVKNNRIHDYLDLAGADFKSNLDSIEITPPHEFKGKLSYGYFFQYHQRHPWEPNRIPFIIENGVSWHREKITRIWLDRNHDLNFDNEIPDTFLNGRGKGYFAFVERSMNSSGVIAQVFPSNRFSRFSNLNDISINEMSNGRTFLGTANSLKIERINTLYNQVLFGRDTLTLGLMDVNSNGKFGDAQVDKWLISRGSDSLLNHEFEFLVSEKSSFAWMGYAYEIKWNEDSILAELIPITKKVKDMPSLMIGEKLPCFKYCSTNKEKPRQKSNTKTQKMKVFVLWSAENTQFISDSSQLHDLIRRTSDSIDWVFLNFGGSGKYVFQYNKRYDLQISQGFCNSKIAKKLKLQQLPQYFFWSRNQELIWTGSHILDLSDLIYFNVKRQ